MSTFKLLKRFGLFGPLAQTLADEIERLQLPLEVVEQHLIRRMRRESEKEESRRASTFHSRKFTKFEVDWLREDERYLFNRILLSDERLREFEEEEQRLLDEEHADDPPFPLFD